MKTKPTEGEPAVARRPAWSWLPRMLFESALIVFSVLFALGTDQWRSDRERLRKADVALAGIRTEVETNLQSAERARDNHRAMRDSLTHYVALRQPPPARIYLGGIFTPAPTHAVAWESAREAGITGDLPYRLVLEIARVYDRQARYRALADAVVQDLMIQVRREGMDPVLRDHAAAFVSLQEDFANRESGLIEAYRALLMQLGAQGSERS